VTASLSGMTKAKSSSTIRLRLAAKVWTVRYSRWCHQRTLYHSYW